MRPLLLSASVRIESSGYPETSAGRFGCASVTESIAAGRSAESREEGNKQGTVRQCGISCWKTRYIITACRALISEIIYRPATHLSNKNGPSLFAFALLLKICG
jgi:hypothetical protein